MADRHLWMADRHSAIILFLKSGNMFNGEKTKFGTRFSESVFWCFLGGGFYLFFISRLKGNVF